MGLLRGFADNLSYRIIYHVPEQILPGLWLMGWQDWLGIRWVAGALTLGFAVAMLPLRRTGVPLFLTLVPYCVLMCIYSWGGSFRFWIPITSLMIVLMIIHHGPRLLSPAGSGWGRALRQGVIVTLMLAYASNMLTYIRRHEQNPFALDFADMVSLFEQAILLQGKKSETLTDHEAIYTFITGHPAALAVPRLGPEPIYSHFIMHLSRVPYATPIIPPPGAVVVRQVGNWAMYKLSVPMTKADLMPRN
jgi:hypothetical protein